MKKKFLCMLLAGTMVFSFAACKSKDDQGDTAPTPTTAASQPTAEPAQSPAEVDFSVKELLGDILSRTAADMALMELGEMEISELYGIDVSKLEEYSVFIPMMNVQATEYAMFKAASADDVQAVVDGINTRVENLKQTWSQYLADQMELVENNKVIVQGNYVFLIIADEDSSAYAENVFLRQFDPSIEEIVLVRKFYRLENAVIAAVSEDALTVETEEEGKTYTFECTYSENFYAEGGLSEYAVGDEVFVTFEEEVRESESPMQAVVSYLAPSTEE